MSGDLYLSVSILKVKNYNAQLIKGFMYSLDCSSPWELFSKVNRQETGTLNHCYSRFFLLGFP